VTGPRASNVDVWVTDLERGVPRQFTFPPAHDSNPVWSPDSTRIAYFCAPNICVKDADGGGSPQVLLTVPGGVGYPSDWSPDGSHLLYLARDGIVFMAPVAPGGKPVRVGSRDGRSGYASFSPDGRFISYSSDESGRNEVWVQALPPATQKWKVSIGGGNVPRWNPIGREMFFVSDEGMMAVDVTLEQTFSTRGVPRLLFPLPTAMVETIRANGYDVSPDGQRFLLPERRSDAVDNPITVVLNWWTALEQGPK